MGATVVEEGLLFERVGIQITFAELGVGASAG